MDDAVVVSSTSKQLNSRGMRYVIGSFVGTRNRLADDHYCSGGPRNSRKYLTCLAVDSEIERIGLPDLHKTHHLCARCEKFNLKVMKKNAEGRSVT